MIFFFFKTLVLDIEKTEYFVIDEEKTLSARYFPLLSDVENSSERERKKEERVTDIQNESTEIFVKIR